MSHFDNIDKNMPILIVDDLSTTRRVVCNCLRKLGFDNVTEAEDVDQAIFHLHSGEFGFVISNWSLLSSQGVRPTDLAVNKRHNQQIPCVVVTSEAQKGAAESAVAHSRGACIVKPFTADLLKEKMTAALDKKSA